MVKLKKRLLSLLLASICALAAAASDVPASAAVSSATVKEAYLAFVLKNETAFNQMLPQDTTMDQYAQIGIKDMDSDGLPELFVSLGTSDRIYTYRDGAIRLVSKTSGNQTFYYCSSRQLICKYNHTSSSVFTETYYALKKGSLSKKYTLSAKKENKKTVYYLNRNKISTTKYQSFRKKYPLKKISTTNLEYRQAIGLLSPGFSRSNYTARVGDTVTLDLFQNISDKTSYASKNKSVAYFANDADRTYGVVTAKSPGTATITATAGNESYQCTVTVTEEKPLVTEPVLLKAGKTYQEDLNGDGKKDSIQWNCDIDYEKETFQFVLKINGKDYSALPFSTYFTTSEYVSVYLTDLNPSDSKKELEIEGYGPSDVVTCSQFYSFDGKKVTKYAELDDCYQFGRYYFLGVTKEGQMRFCIDTPFWDENLGMYFATADFSFKDTKSTALIMNDTRCYIENSARFTPLTKLAVTKEMGGSETAFTLNPGSLCYIDSVVKKGSQLYLQVSNRSGTSGWIKLPKKQIFYESHRNLWG